MSQCHSPGSTTWQWGCPRRSSQNPNASSIALGVLNAREAVVIRTTALNTHRRQPETRITRYDRGEPRAADPMLGHVPAEGMDQDIHIRQDHLKFFSRRM